MLNLKKQIPNLLTLSNLLCGTFIIISAFQLEFLNAAYWAVAALMFDFLDGTAARLLNVSSSIGKELDSMADMVSFGVAPAMVLFNYWSNELYETGSLVVYFPLLIAVFSGYRLAKFNVSEQNNDYFSGLPTPALALASFALPLAGEQFELANIWLNNPFFIMLFCIIGALLLTSNIKLFSIKIGSQNKKLNIIRVAMLLTCALLIGWLHFLGGFLCLIVYLVFSLAFQKLI
ncbi:MAG TPA: CDP-diacylglycerol--serine O-phosphatidyltransferase [Bacteroidetes bacterium]|jgi:CDP-diacylglycerol---serine O-phosphatidyltransferase|nr:CDP-diacylglycerol--serine O-phosphatidyltransferase [Bacteroidota bacterium]